MVTRRSKGVTGKTLTVVSTIAALAVMVGLTAASVPLYRLFCKVTGLGGTPQIVSGAPLQAAKTRTIEIRFDTNVAKDLPWRFQPDQRAITVHLGEPNIATFTAKNNSSAAMVGTAAFNVTPAKAGIYVDKIQCFCFTQQTLQAGQTMEMPVQFYIDPAIASDPDTNDVTTITLSYSFFRTPQRSEGAS
jgi:cytochrome c oxidase assembly protein subunit 11